MDEVWSEGQNGCREQVGYVWESGGRSQGQLRKSFMAQKMETCKKGYLAKCCRRKGRRRPIMLNCSAG